MKKIISICIISIFCSTFLVGCVRKTEYDNKEITSILYYSIDGFGVGCGYKLYDFQNLTYSEKDWESWEKYKIITDFTKEKADNFFKDIKKHGIFLLEKSYKTDEIIMDGSSSFLVITFSDKTTFESSFYYKYPNQAKKLDKDFLVLSGYKLFNV